MNARKRTGSQNSMVNRVLRHTSIATLQRNAYPEGDNITLNLGRSTIRDVDIPSEGQLSKARLLPPSSQLPWGEVIGQPPNQATDLNQFDNLKTPPGPELPLPQENIVERFNLDRPSRDAPPPRQEKSETPVTRTSRVRAKIDLPTRGYQDQKSQWDRLKTILQRHQEKKTSGKPDSDKETETSARSVVNESEPPPRQAENTPEIPSILSGVPSRDQSEEASPPSPDGGIQRSESKTDLDSPHQTSEKTSSPIQRGSLMEQQNLPALENKTPDATLPPNLDEFPKQYKSDDVVEAPNTEVQNIPLQNVWPVQQKDDNLEIPPKESSTKPYPLQGETQQPESAANVPEALKGISPGHRSDSSVEFIPPRRPRPDTSAKTTIQRRSSDIPTETIDDQSLTFPQEDNLTEQFPSERNPENASTSNREQELSSIQKESSKQKTVSTEIGPLPGDLWKLLGQPLPENSPAEGRPADHQETLETHTHHPEPPGQAGPVQLDPVENEVQKLEMPRILISSEPAGKKSQRSQPSEISKPALDSNLQRAVVKAETKPKTSPPEKLTTGEAGGDVIQTYPFQTSSRLETTTAPQVNWEPASMDETAPTEGLDVDELARRVYLEVRRRLTIERERMQRRY